MQGESVLRATYSHHKVILEGPDAAFLCVTPMHARWNNLVHDIIVCIKVCGGFEAPFGYIRLHFGVGK